MTTVNLLRQISLVPSTLRHVRELSQTIRDKDKAEILALGMTVKQGIYKSYKACIWSRTALLDDKVVAMFGVSGSILGNIGYPYLLTSDEVYKMSPLQFTRLYIQQVKDMKELFSMLESHVDSDYPEALRLLQMSGFKFVDAVEVNNHLFYKMSL